MTKVSTNSKNIAPRAPKKCGSEKCPRVNDSVNDRVKRQLFKNKRSSIDLTVEAPSKKKQKQNSMTVKDLKAALAAAGIPYEKSAKKADLQKIYDIYKIVQKPSTVDLPTSGKAVKPKSKAKAKKKQDSVAPKGAYTFKSMLDECGIDGKSFTDTVCGVVDAAIKCSDEKKQIEMLRKLIQNVKIMDIDVQNNRANQERLYKRLAAGLEPDAEPYMWCLLIAAKIITSWDELLTEIGFQYDVEDDGELEPFYRYLDVVDAADALYKKKLISNFQYGIVTGDGAYKANKKKQEANWEVLRYLFDQENRFEDDTWDELVKHGKKLHPITEDAMNMIGVSNKKRNSNTKRKRVSNDAKQFYKNQQKNWTKDELVAECKRRKIPYSGSKLKLMERCRIYENKLNRDSDSDSSSDSYSDSSSDSSSDLSSDLSEESNSDSEEE